MQILMCGNTRGEKGGINTVVEQILHHQWLDNIDVTYVGTYRDGSKIKKILEFLKGYRQCHSLSKNKHISVMHFHMSERGSFYRKYMLMKLAKRHHAKTIVHMHGADFKEFYEGSSENIKRKIRWLLEEADVVLTLGINWKEYVESIVPDANVIILHNSVSVPEEYHRMKHRDTTFLYLGVLNARKGVMDLLKAAKQLKDMKYPFKLMIAGSGEQEDELKSYSISNHMESQVQFLGWVNAQQKQGIFDKADVLVLPSYNEGLPMAILESMAQGLPIIATDVGSISDAVTDGENGCLMKAGDIDRLMNGMKSLIESTPTWEKYSRKSYEKAKQFFSEEQFFEQLEEIYEKLVEEVEV